MYDIQVKVGPTNLDQGPGMIGKELTISIVLGQKLNKIIKNRPVLKKSSRFHFLLFWSFHPGCVRD